MNIQYISITQIKPAPYNPRQDLGPDDPEYQQLTRSLDEFGLVEPLVWNRRTGNLVGGHQRFKVLVAQGLEKIPVSVVDLPLEKEKALNIALNKIQGDWDTTKLAQLLDELVKAPAIDIELTGFELPEVEDLITGYLDASLEGREEQFDLEAELDHAGPTITEPGELLELGQHRLLCGDCTDSGEVRRLMDGKRAVLFATDPPYLVGYDGTNRPTGKAKRRKRLKQFKELRADAAIEWDDPQTNVGLYEEFIGVAVAEAIALNAAWYCWHASRRQTMVEQAWEQFGAFVHQQIIWIKHHPVPGYSWYTWQHEPCFFGWVKPNKPKRYGKEYLSTIWQVSSLQGKLIDHPTSKPVELFAIPIRQHTRRGQICYEPFCGSGSQLIAAEQYGRRCYAIEISPKYCDLIVRRWIHFIGEAAAPQDLVEKYCSNVHMEVKS